MQDAVPDIRSFEFACCYCDTVMQGEPFQVILLWPGDDGDEQVWWCHRDCFANSLNPGYRMFHDEEGSGETANGC